MFDTYDVWRIFGVYVKESLKRNNEFQETLGTILHLFWCSEHCDKMREEYPGITYTFNAWLDHEFCVGEDKRELYSRIIRLICE